MPRKRKNEIAQKIDYKEWIWCIDNLSKAQLEAYDEASEHTSEYFDKMTVLIEDGFSCTTKRDYYNNCILVSAVNDYTGFHNSGLCLSARSDSAPDAWGILLYKYFIVAERDLRPFADSKPNFKRG
jgi:hypothetical protein